MSPLKMSSYWLLLAIAITFYVKTVNCQTFECGSPGRPAHGHATTVKTSFSTGEKINFACEQGFVIVGDTDRQCLTNGTWSGQLPFCVTPSPTVKYTQSGISSCSSNFQRVIDGDVETCVNIYVNGSKVWWVMDMSQLDDDDEIIELLIKVEVPAEREHSFETLQILISNTNLNPTDYNSQNLKCEDRYPKVKWEKHTFRLPTQKGQKNGRTLFLVSKIPAPFSYLRICEVIFITAGRSQFSCGDPEVPLKGSVTRKEMHTAVYQCDEGYQLVGAEIRTCNDDNYWSLPIAECIHNLTGLSSDSLSVPDELPSRPPCVHDNSNSSALTQEQQSPTTFFATTNIQVVSVLSNYSTSATEEVGLYFHIAVGVSVFLLFVVGAFTVFLCHLQNRKSSRRNSSVATASTGVTLFNDTYYSNMGDDFSFTLANHYAENPQPEALSSRRNSRLPSSSSSEPKDHRTSTCSDSHSKKLSCCRHSMEVRERERPPLEIKLPRANSTSSLIQLPDGPHIYAEICDNQLPPTPMLRRSHPVDRPPSTQAVILSPVYSEPDDVNNELVVKNNLPIYTEPYGTHTLRLN